jgi:hypothetical protein
MKTMMERPDTLLDLGKNDLAGDQKEELKDMMAGAGVKWILETLAELCEEQSRLAFTKQYIDMWAKTARNIRAIPEVVS